MLDGGGALSRRGLAIKAIADLGDEVEVVVVGPPHRGADGNYMVKMLARRSSDGEHAILYLPIGTLPLLSSGRVFSKGKRLDFARNGRIDDLVIPDLATFQELGSNEAPEGLVSALRLPTGMGGRRSQQLFQYNVNGRRVFIPAVELARALYLRYAALAQVVMRPQGLMELCVAPAPNSYQHLELEFTSELPVGLLKGHGGRLFAERFAWIAVDPEARRGWDSILRRTQSGEVLRFDPPSIRQAPCRVRSIEDGPDVLVLEILSLGGRRHPCESLEFSHPALVKKVRHVLASQGGDWESEKGSGADAGGEPGVRKPVTTKLILDHEGKGSKSDGTKEKTTLYADEFESTIVVRAKHREIEIAGGQDAAAPVDTDMDGASGNGKTYSGTGPGGLATTPSGGDGKRPQAGSSPDGRPDPLKSLTGVDPPELRRRKVSVAEPNSGTVLKSLDFELLETMETNWIGELKALIAVLRRMAANLPGVRVASSLTPIRDGRAVSRVGDSRLDRRPALVGVLWPSDQPPRVLLEVDHTDALPLALLVLRYRAEPCMIDIETDVRALLDAMVARGGSWNLDVVTDRTDKVPLDVERMAKVLRLENAEKMPHYLGAWTLELIERLELYGYFRG